MIVVWIVLGVVVVMGAAAFVGAPYVPSHARQVERAFTALRPLTNRDVVVDLGSGDGIVLRKAIGLGAGRAVGYEINPLLVWLSRALSARNRAVTEVRTVNMWRSQPPHGVTVVYIFGVGRDMGRLARLLQTWATTANRPLACIVYGHTLPGIDADRQEGAHRLYTVRPLHDPKAQV